MNDPIKALRELLAECRDVLESMSHGPPMEDSLRWRIDAALAALGGEHGVAVFNCARCPVSVESRWLEPTCPECGDPCQFDPSAKPSPPPPGGKERG